MLKKEKSQSTTQYLFAKEQKLVSVLKAQFQSFYRAETEVCTKSATRGQIKVYRRTHPNLTNVFVLEGTSIWKY